MSFRSQHVFAGLFASVSIVAITGSALPAYAGLPTTRLMSAPAISPDQAWQYFDGQAGLSTRTATYAAMPGVAPEIRALARALGSEQIGVADASGITKEVYARRVADYLRYNITTEFRFGLGKGARGAVIDQSGTPFDQAELMFELLKQANISASYLVGAKSYSAQDMGRWTGVVRAFSTPDVNGVQAVTVNAKALCRFLADGGIPVQMNFNGGSVASCDGLSGDLGASDSITIAHIQVQAEGLLFDPSFKRQTFRSGEGIGAGAGCAQACGSQAVEALLRDPSGAAEVGSYLGRTSYKKLNETALNAKLTAQATALEAYVANAYPAGSVEDFIGGSKIDQSFAPAIAAAGSFTAKYTWTEKIPDVFRSKISVPMRENKTFEAYGDELSGQRLWYVHSYFSAENGYVSPTSVYKGICQYTTCDYTITVNHPYPAVGGKYADEDIVINKTPFKDALAPSIYAITLSWGESSGSTEAHYSALQRAKPAGAFAFKPSNPFLTERCGLSCAASLHSVAASMLQAQTTSNKLVDTVTRTSTTRHLAIGTLMPGARSSERELTDVNLHTSVSVQARDGDDDLRENSFEAASMLSAMLEGGVLQYAKDSWEQHAAPGLYSQLNINNRTFIDAPKDVANSIMNGLGYNNTTKASLQQRVTEGYSFILPGNTDVGRINVNNGYATIDIAGYYGYRPASDLDPTDDGAVALLVAGTLKGGAGTYAGERPDVSLRNLTAGNGDRGKINVSDVDLANGALRISAIDLPGGKDGFPKTLPFERYYASDGDAYEEVIDNAWVYDGPDANSFMRLSGGWTHNYAYSASLGTSLDAAFGRQGVLAATPMLVGLNALFDLRKTSNFDRRLTALFVANWINSQVNGNAVIISRPRGAESFYRLASGGYTGAPGGASAVSVTGARSAPTMLNGKVAYSYENVRVSVTGGDGDVLSFEPQYSFDEANQHMWPRQFRAVAWKFPTGVNLTFEYDTHTRKGQKRYFLNGVSNNLGRRLSFESEGKTQSDELIDSTMWRLKKVSDEAGNAVSYETTDCPSPKQMTCAGFKVTLPGSRVISYAYGADSASPDPTGSPRLPYRLRRVYAPSSSTTPAHTIVYDDLYHVKALSNRAGQSSAFYTGGVSGGEEWNRGVVVSPRQDQYVVTTSIFDWRNNPLQVTSPLQRTTRNTYDSAGRVVRSQMPEGNAVITTYDVRSNVTSTCQTPKPDNLEAAPRACNAPTDPQTITTFKEGDKVRNCLNPASCNKPISEKDARGGVTTYDWNNTTGLLQSIKPPLDAEGKQSETSYGYADFSGTDGATFKLLKTHSQTIATGRNRDTQYEYDTANKFVLKSMTVDPTGVAARTCFKFDTSGRLIESTGPRGGVC